MGLRVECTWIMGRVGDGRAEWGCGGEETGILSGMGVRRAGEEEDVNTWSVGEDKNGSTVELAHPRVFVFARRRVRIHPRRVGRGFPQIVDAVSLSRATTVMKAKASITPYESPHRMPKTYRKTISSRSVHVRASRLVLGEGRGQEGEVSRHSIL